MNYLLLSILLVLAATVCNADGCENPASFKKCLQQTRAEVNICGINMTCKCLRQADVVRCYEKCGDEDKYYRKLALGEKGQQQIFCSQKTPGEPDDMPIIGKEGGGAPKKSTAKAKPKEKKQVPLPPPPPPPPPPKANNEPAGRVSLPPMDGVVGFNKNGNDPMKIRNMDADSAVTNNIPGFFILSMLTLMV